MVLGCTFQLMIPGGTCHLYIVEEVYKFQMIDYWKDQVVTLTKRDKVAMGVMEKIHSRRVSISVKNLLQASQVAESSTSINEKIGKWLIKRTHNPY